MLAIGFALIYNVTGILHLSHGAIFSLGGYVVWWVVAQGWSLVAALVIAVLVTAATGVLNHVAVYRPLRRRGSSNLGYFVGSLAFAIVLQNVLAILSKNVPLFMPNANRIQAYHIGSVYVTELQIIGVLVAALLGALTLALLNFTEFGLNARAVASNPEMARVVGINTERTYVAVYAIGSAATVPAAAIVAYQVGLTPYFGTIYVLNVIAGAILGGIGSFAGPILGGLGVGIVQDVSLLVLPTVWQYSVAFALTLLMLLVRPYGVFGKRPRQEALR
jgi:branched-chain amino acid transport system permease protein